jgi:hypothetical protein
MDRFENALVGIQEGNVKKEDLFKFELTDLQKAALQLL